jgi:predicted NBD/HSP70 family sugar kinase
MDEMSEQERAARAAPDRRSDRSNRNGSPTLMRQINAMLVLKETRRAGVVSRADLVRATGLTAPSVTNVVDYLCNAGYLRVAEPEPSKRGVRAPLYEFAADVRNVLGIDIGADKLVVVLADLNGKIIGMRRRDTSQLGHRGPKRLLALVGETAEKLLAEHKVPTSDLLAVGAGTPGVISPTGIVTLAPQLQGWEGLDLQAALAEIFHCTIYVDREVTLALLAEQWVGVARDMDDALFVQLGVGVGSALLTGGRTYPGADGGAGEIGLMPVIVGSGSGRKPLYGPLESVVGGAALAREGAAAARGPKGSVLLALAGGKPDEVTAATVFAAAAKGDKASAAIVTAALATLAQAIAGVVCALNPRAVILSGGMSRAGDQILRPLEAFVAAQVPFAPRFLISTTGEEAVALGAVWQVIQTLEQRLITPAVGVEQ